MTKDTPILPAKTKRKITRLKNLQEKNAALFAEIERLKKQISAEVAELESSFTYRGLPVVYMPEQERTYWNGKSLAAFAADNPGAIDDYVTKSKVPAYAYVKI